MDFMNLPTDIGRLLLKEVGTVALNAAELLNENSIEVQSPDDFKSIAVEIGYPILNAGLEQIDGIWYFAAELKTEDGMEGFAPQVCAYEMENPEAVHTIKAHLHRHTEQESNK